MYNLSAFSLQDMVTCGAALRCLGENAASTEEVANRIVRYLYDHLADSEGESDRASTFLHHKTLSADMDN